MARLVRLTTGLGIVAAWVAFFKVSRPHAYPQRVSPGFAAVTIAAVVVIVALAREAVDKMSFMRALLTFIGALSIIMVLFAGAYYSHGTTKDWTEPLSHIDAVYVTMGTLSTAGTGGIAAKSQLARGLITLQMGIDLIVMTGAFGVLIGTFVGRRTVGNDKIDGLDEHLQLGGGSTTGTTSRIQPGP